MAQGFLFESDRPRRMVGAWVEGPPQRSWSGNAKVRADKCVPVGTFRCSACGFLESQARPEFGPNYHGFARNGEPFETRALAAAGPTTGRYASWTRAGRASI